MTLDFVYWSHLASKINTKCPFLFSFNIAVNLILLRGKIIHDTYCPLLNLLLTQRQCELQQLSLSQCYSLPAIITWSHIIRKERISVAKHTIFSQTFKCGYLSNNSAVEFMRPSPLFWINKGILLHVTYFKIKLLAYCYEYCKSRRHIPVARGAINRLLFLGRDVCLLLLFERSTASYQQHPH